MNKVVTINLGGRAYQLEESGYEALRAYLDDAQARLAEDPGRSEIIADLEQAIGEKCDKVLAPHKTVVSTDEVKKIISEMGPVEGEAKKENSQEESASAKGPRAPKRFFLIREDAVFAGVCAGIAAYFDIDVTIIRVGFVALTVFTGGLWVLLYLALALLVPYADTAEARAQAHGKPFNAEALVQQAKERWSESYERVTGNKWDDLVQGATSAHDAHRKWRDERKQQKQQWKQQWKAYKYRRQWNPAYGMLRAILAIAWIAALLSLIKTGAVFGWMVPGLPVWLAIVILFVVFFMITGPLQAAQYGPYGIDDPVGKYYYHSDPWDGFVGVLTAIFVLIAFIWAYDSVPQFYAAVHHPIGDGIRPIVTWLKSL